MLITIDLGSDRALYLQIAEGVQAAVATGRLAPGDRLPPGRELAATLGVNLETVQRAYRRLAADGIATSRVGRGTRIIDDLDPSTIGVNLAIASTVEAAKVAGVPLDQLLSLVRQRWADQAEPPAGRSGIGPLPAS
jgi:DNA-binding transcriptional regulator YhcF (GntR family)